MVFVLTNQFATFRFLKILEIVIFVVVKSYHGVAVRAFVLPW